MVHVQCKCEWPVSILGIWVSASLIMRWWCLWKTFLLSISTFQCTLCTEDNKRWGQTQCHKSDGCFHQLKERWELDCLAIHEISCSSFLCSHFLKILVAFFLHIRVVWLQITFRVRIHVHRLSPSNLEARGMDLHCRQACLMCWIVGVVDVFPVSCTDLYTADGLIAFDGIKMCGYESIFSVCGDEKH